MNLQHNTQEDFPIYPRKFNWLLIFFAFAFFGLCVSLEYVSRCQPGWQAVHEVLIFVFIFALVLISLVPHPFFVSLTQPKGPELVFSTAGITFSDLGFL